MLSTTHQTELDRRGYVVLENLLPISEVQLLRDRVEELYAVEGDRAGDEFKQEPGSRRLANLLNKGEIFFSLIEHPMILPLVSYVLGGSVKLSSLNARSANPPNKTAQPLHADMGAIVDERGSWVCNTVWMLDDFTPENGPLRAVPGSHQWKQLPQNSLDDPAATHPEQELITGQAGTVVVMNAHVWHGGQANRTDQPRRALHAFYTRRDKPQQQYQKQLLGDVVKQQLTSPQRELLALDDPQNDQLCQSDAPRSGFLN